MSHIEQLMELAENLAEKRQQYQVSLLTTGTSAISEELEEVEETFRKVLSQPLTRPDVFFLANAINALRRQRPMLNEYAKWLNSVNWELAQALENGDSQEKIKELTDKQTELAETVDLQAVWGESAKLTKKRASY